MAGSIRKRGKNSWEVSFEVGRDANGKRQRRAFTVRGNKREAESALTDALYKFERGTDIVPNKITVAEYLERWLLDYARTGVKPSTHGRYQVAVRSHISAHIGQVGLGKLRPAHIIDMLSTCAREGLAAATIGQHYRVLHEALKHAVQWQLLAVNPADAVQPPRISKPERTILDLDTFKKLVDGAHEPLRSIIVIGLHTGARPGEILALRWSDIDFTTGRLQIVRKVQRMPKVGLVFDETKSHRGNRPLSLAKDSLDLLVRIRDTRAAALAKAGLRLKDDDLVFVQHSGDPIDPQLLAHWFKNLALAVGCPGVTFYDLRHASATYLLKANVHPKVVQERLGHATVNITLDTYSHVLPDLHPQAAELLSQAIRLDDESESAGA